MERPAAMPRKIGGRGEPHSPKPGMSGEYRSPTPGPSGDQRELKRACEMIQDLQDQVDSLMGINNNLEMELDSHRVLVQDYEGKVKKMKLENALVGWTAVVGEDDGIKAMTSREVESQEQGTPMKTERTGTTSTVSFMLGELHRERGPASQSSGGVPGVCPQWGTHVDRKGAWSS